MTYYQQLSMNTLVACGVAEKVGNNKYSLTKEGHNANIIGLKKYADSLKDKNRQYLIYHSFGLIKSEIISKISNLSIKGFEIFLASFVLPLLTLIVWFKYKNEIIEFWDKYFK